VSRLLVKILTKRLWWIENKKPKAKVKASARTQGTLAKWGRKIKKKKS